MSQTFNYATPKVMGILNITPDSFSDGGQFLDREAALKQARRLHAEGADIIDIGGESTRPRATPVSAQAELDRVIPLIEILQKELPIPLSIDTSKAIVMQEAIRAGAQMINDIAALRNEGCLEIVAKSPDVQVCLMHMQGEPRTMQQQPIYQNLITEVKQFLLERIAACEQAGIAKSRILLDVGFGFGKTLEHNLILMQHLEIFTALNHPVLIGVSRKSMLGLVLNKPVDERVYGGLALAVIAVLKGAKMIRTHDVAATVDALKMTQAVVGT